jgi:hypothetical protein
MDRTDQNSFQIVWFAISLFCFGLHKSEQAFQKPYARMVVGFASLDLEDCGLEITSDHRLNRLAANPQKSLRPQNQHVFSS